MTTPEDCLDMLKWRYASKKFDSSRLIADEVWQSILESVHLAPSSFGLQLWHFVSVETPEIRSQLRSVSWDQSQVTDASRFLVFCVRRDLTEEDIDKHLRRIAEVRGVSLDSLSLYKERMEGLISQKSPEQIASWMERQVYIALGFAMNSAASMAVDTCPLEGLDPTAYDEILGLSNSPYRSLCALALGYRDSADGYASLAKVRFESGDVIGMR